MDFSVCIEQRGRDVRVCISVHPVVAELIANTYPVSGEFNKVVMACAKAGYAALQHANERSDAAGDVSAVQESDSSTRNVNDDEVDG